MKPVITLALLLGIALPALAQQVQPLTKEEEARKEEILKKNPQLREQIEANEKRGLRIKTVKDNKITLDSITGQPVEPAAVPAEGAVPADPNATAVVVPVAPVTVPEEPKFMGNAEIAEKAYHNKDYKTALENYRALAREGDPKATLMVGIMQQEGQGMKKDKAAAYAWYGRAAELGDGTADQIVRGMNDNDELSKKERQAAAKQYEDLSKEFDKPEVAKDAGDRFEGVQSQTQVNTRTYNGSAPSSIKGGDSASTKRPATYARDPARTGKTEDFKAGSYNQPSDD